MIEQLSSAGSVTEVLETLAEQEEVKYPPPMSYHSKMLDFSDLQKQVKTQQLTQAVATIHHLQKLAHHLGQVGRCAS